MVVPASILRDPLESIAFDDTMSLDDMGDGAFEPRPIANNIQEALADFHHVYQQQGLRGELRVRQLGTSCETEVAYGELDRRENWSTVQENRKSNWTTLAHIT